MLYSIARLCSCLLAWFPYFNTMLSFSIHFHAIPRMILSFLEMENSPLFLPTTLSFSMPLLQIPRPLWLHLAGLDSTAIVSPALLCLYAPPQLSCVGLPDPWSPCSFLLRDFLQSSWIIFCHLYFLASLDLWAQLCLCREKSLCSGSPL